ncbi:CPCC family cysteine-rich protein [Xanthomonas arboricola]|uniref:CPCC family cysteine-rich protein n=1 Tax=Xanthomonas arboricola TaxID=56448 RepID=UPI001930F751
MCLWKDDGQDDEDADEVRVGRSRHISLSQGWLNYREFGACRKKDLLHARPPRPDEMLAVG